MLLFLFQNMMQSGWGRDVQDNHLRDYAHKKREKVEAVKKQHEIEAQQYHHPEVKKLNKSIPVVVKSDDPNYPMYVATYKKIIPCLINNRYARGTNISRLVPPIDLKSHYLDLLDKTKIFRGIPYHVYHYAGPWIGKWVLHDCCSL